MYAKAVTAVALLSIFAAVNAQYSEVYERAAEADPNKVGKFFKGIFNKGKEVLGGILGRDLELIERAAVEGTLTRRDVDNFYERYAGLRRDAAAEAEAEAAGYDTFDVYARDADAFAEAEAAEYDTFDVYARDADAFADPDIFDYEY